MCIVNREEAVRRIVERDGKTQEEAEKRLDSQMSTAERIKRANVVFSTQWAGEYTQKQVQRAWADLSSRLAVAYGKSKKGDNDAATAGGKGRTVSPQPKSRV